MLHVLRETFILIGAPAAIALVVLIAGTAIAQTQSNVDPPQGGTVSRCLTATVLAASSSGAGGSAQLCTAADALHPAVYAVDLLPGRTYSVWLLSLDCLASCQATSYTNDDLFDFGRPDVSVRLGEVPASSDGRVEFRSHFAGPLLAGGTTVALLLMCPGVGTAMPTGPSVQESFTPTH